MKRCESPFIPGLMIGYSSRAKRWMTIETTTGKLSKFKTHANSVYRKLVGTVPKNWHVHHKNGDATKVEYDDPSNLMLLPAEWNYKLIPSLALGFDIPEKQVTQVYIKYMDKHEGSELFRMIVKDLLKNG